jgi:dienelactone hydrolase
MRALSKPLSVAQLCVLGACAGLAQDQPLTLRYDFKPGDHLIYRETFEREGKSPEQSFHSRVAFLNHVLVVDVANGTALVGVQRNRRLAELLEYRVKGQDRLVQETADFDRRVARRPARFFDANVYSAIGLPQLPLQILREVNSDLLYGVSEMPALPAAPAQTGLEWANGSFGLQMHMTGRETVSGESCIKAADTGHGRIDAHLSYTFCPQSGHVTKLSFEGRYSQLGDSKIHERVTLELIAARQGEAPALWLGENGTQLGTLAAYLLPITAKPDAGAVEKLLHDDNADLQALTLAVMYEQKITVAPETLKTLGASGDAQVRRIAGRFSTQSNQAAVPKPCPLPGRAFLRQKAGTTLHSLADGRFAGTPYIMRVPMDYRGDQPFPLIVYLSGGGGRALDGAHSSENVLRDTGYLAVFPQANGLWWEQQPTEMVDALLQQLLRDYNIDSNRVYISGFSNGGTGALLYATLWPDRFAAASALMGAGVQSPAAEKPALMNLQNVPVLLVHGDKDQRIPSSATTATYAALQGFHPRVAPEIHILPNREHNITLDSDDGYTLPFFQRFTREPWPRSINAQFSDAGSRRQYWVEVLEKGTGSAQINAQILNNLIELKTKNVTKLRLLLRPALFAGSSSILVRVNGKELPSHDLARDCSLFGKSAQQYGDAYLAYTDELTVAVK